MADLPRFSIRSLTALIAAIAVICAVTFAVPNPIARGVMILFVTMLLPALLATIFVCGTDRQRVFSIGALIPSGVALMSLATMAGMRLFESFEFARRLEFGPMEFAAIVGEHCRWFFASCWLLSLCVGVTCYAVSFLFQSKSIRDNHGGTNNVDQEVNKNQVV